MRAASLLITSVRESCASLKAQTSKPTTARRSATDRAIERVSPSRTPCRWNAGATQ